MSVPGEHGALALNFGGNTNVLYGGVLNVLRRPTHPSLNVVFSSQRATF